jgi:hypothetical protein
MTERFIKLTTDDNFTVVSIPACPDKELDNSFNEFVHRELDCDIYEAVWLLHFCDHNIVMLVDESGLLKDKSVNLFAWAHYSRLNMRAPIVGDVLFASTHLVGELHELDFCGLDQEQIDFLTKAFNDYSNMIR